MGFAISAGAALSGATRCAIQPMPIPASNDAAIAGRLRCRMERRERWTGRAAPGEGGAGLAVDATSDAATSSSATRPTG
jgi:hypothetical protein